MSLTEDETDSGEFQDIAEKNYQRIKNKAIKLGYADGVTNGRENELFQQRFDQGYKDGLRTSFEIDKYRHFFENLNVDKVNNPELQELKILFDTLEVNDSKSPDHFQYVKYKNENLDVVSQKQNEYVNDACGSLEQNLPQTSILLKTQHSVNFV